jgi:ABC-2 type transport system permease protein
VYAAAAGRSAASRERSAASRGPIALLWHQVRYDLLATFRNPRARFFTFLFPVILLVVFIGVFGDKGNTVIDGVRVPLSRFYVGGILAMAIITAAYATLVITITTARETGVFKRRRATPVPPALMIAGQVIATLTIAEAMTAILLIVGRVGYSISMPAGAVVAVFVTVAVGAITFACIAYAIAGMIDSVDAAQPIAQLTMMPLYFISGVWIPTASLSHGLRSVASVFPIEHLAAALHKATVTGSLGSALSLGDLAVLAAWGLAAGAFAAARFSWLPKAAMA